LRYLQSWIDQLRWQRLKPLEKPARMLLNHLEGILNYCKIKVPLGVVEAVNGNIKALSRRGRGYRDLDYLLLRRRAWPPLRPNSSRSGKPHRMHVYPDSRSKP
jgi:transposase